MKFNSLALLRYLMMESSQVNLQVDGLSPPSLPFYGRQNILIKLTWKIKNLVIRMFQTECPSSQFLTTPAGQPICPGYLHETTSLPYQDTPSSTNTTNNNHGSTQPENKWDKNDLHSLREPSKYKVFMGLSPISPPSPELRETLGNEETPLLGGW